jgi:hypothetical protein
MGKDEVLSSAPAETPAPAPKKSSGNIRKRNQTGNVIEMVAASGPITVNPYEVVEMSNSDWNSPGVQMYAEILK